MHTTKITQTEYFDTLDFMYTKVHFNLLCVCYHKQTIDGIIRHYEVCMFESKRTNSVYILENSMPQDEPNEYSMTITTKDKI